jgi:hypothetical protein
VFELLTARVLLTARGNACVPCLPWTGNGCVSLTLPFGFVLSHALRGDQGSTERVTYQVSSAVMWCGFDENLEQGARCSRQPTTSNIRACLWKILQRNFPHRRSSRCQKINLQAAKKQTSPYSKHTSWKKK